MAKAKPEAKEATHVTKELSGEFIAADKLTKIYSLESADTTYTSYEKPKEGVLVEVSKSKMEVTIKGGAKVAYSDTDRVRRNQTYVVTKVNQKQLDFLLEHPVFKRVVKRGFITIGEQPTDFISDNSAQISQAKLKDLMPKVEVSLGEG